MHVKDNIELRALRTILLFCNSLLWQGRIYKAQYYDIKDIFFFIKHVMNLYSSSWCCMSCVYRSILALLLISVINLCHNHWVNYKIIAIIIWLILLRSVSLKAGLLFRYNPFCNRSTFFVIILFKIFNELRAINPGSENIYSKNQNSENIFSVPCVNYCLSII